MALGMHLSLNFFQRYTQCVGQTIADTARKDPGFGEFSQPAAKYEQLSGEVAAVDSRYILWCQRCQRLRVVPVEEMAPIAFHFRDRTKCLLRAIKQAAC